MGVSFRNKVCSVSVVALCSVALLCTTVAAFIPVEALLILTVILQLYSGFCYFSDKEMRVAA